MARNKPQNYLAPPPPETEVMPLEPQKPQPYMIAYTIERVVGGWSLVKVCFKDNELISVEKSEPDLKAVAVERLKIDSVKYWNSIG